MTPLRYAVVHHTGIAEPHFDVMFETAPGSALTTFRLPLWPPAARLAAVPLAEHRAAYLDYEGPVSGNRGEVRRVQSGTCHVVSNASGWVLDFSPTRDLTSLHLERDATGAWTAVLCRT
jgi:hypothetical protein